MKGAEAQEKKAKDEVLSVLKDGFANLAQQNNQMLQVLMRMAQPPTQPFYGHQAGSACYVVHSL
jgi:hypothetical protein